MNLRQCQYCEFWSYEDQDHGWADCNKAVACGMRTKKTSALCNLFKLRHVLISGNTVRFLDERGKHPLPGQE